MPTMLSACMVRVWAFRAASGITAHSMTSSPVSRWSRLVEKRHTHVLLCSPLQGKCCGIKGMVRGSLIFFLRTVPSDDQGSWTTYTWIGVFPFRVLGYIGAVSEINLGSRR